MNNITILLVVLSFALSGFSYNSLPSELPMHWNLYGQVDNWMPKTSAVWFFPILIGALWLLFRILPQLDPKKDKYVHFRHEWSVMQAGLMLFFVYMQSITFYLAAHPGVAMLPLLFIGLGSLFILLGNYLSKVRQNYFIGIKLPWTLQSEDNWNKTHRFGSWCFVIAGLITLAEAYLQWYAPLIVFGSIMAASFLPMIYSYWIFKKK